ncbi:nitronate monooxygenase [Paramicrobacterium humi]|uniref:Nitronate monooxygenase n=2 Tax=Paramicrobacterium humi TaxID=640635 RepID=A0A1H4PX80_9MICO|nr:nitronate monooxygenase [Microbacterium humi]
MLGVPSAPELGTLDQAAAELEEQGAVWGAGFLSFALERDLTPLTRVLSHHPHVISLGFGESRAALDAVRDAGAVALAQVGNVDELHSAMMAGVDGIIVRGSEGGGHGRNELSTLTLLQIALDETDIPIIAAGGITTSRGLAAVMAAGARGAWIGTRFASAIESDFQEAAKKRLVSAEPGDTVYTRTFDIAQRAGWPPYYGGRALVNDFAENWHGREDELQKALESNETMTTDMLAARKDGRFDTAPIYAGEGSALIHTIESATDIIADLTRYREHLTAAKQL